MITICTIAIFNINISTYIILIIIITKINNIFILKNNKNAFRKSM